MALPSCRLCEAVVEADVNAMVGSVALHGDDTIPVAKSTSSVAPAPHVVLVTAVFAAVAESIS
jgi:hypothetical protein